MPKKYNPKDVCEVFCFNRAKVDRIKRNILSEERLNALVEIFKAVSDNTRARILLALKDGELCVCDISHVLGLSLSAVSHQLRILRSLGLVKYKGSGKMVFYSLTDEYFIKLIEEGVKHIKK